MPFPWTWEIQKAIEISTVDAFQGREARTVVVDSVAAQDNLQDSPKKEANTPEDTEDLGGEDYVKAGAVTAHVRSPNRLSVALTRVKDATIVLCQAALLASTSKPPRGKQYNAVANRIGDARTCNCWMDDFTEDMYPVSVESRRKGVQGRCSRSSRRRELRSLDFIAASKRNWEETESMPSEFPHEPFKQYCTRGGHTTRPICNPQLVAEADAYDDEQVGTERAKAASLTTEGFKAEDERTLWLGVQQSLDPSEFPALPQARRWMYHSGICRRILRRILMIRIQARNCHLKVRMRGMMMLGSERGLSG